MRGRARGSSSGCRRRRAPPAAPAPTPGGDSVAIRVSRPSSAGGARRALRAAVAGAERPAHEQREQPHDATSGGDRHAAPSIGPSVPPHTRVCHRTPGAGCYSAGNRPRLRRHAVPFIAGGARPSLGDADLRRALLAGRVQRALPAEPRQGADRPLGRLRPADADRLRPRRRARPRRGRQGRRAGPAPRRHAARCSTASRSTR